MAGGEQGLSGRAATHESGAAVVTQGPEEPQSREAEEPSVGLMLSLPRCWGHPRHAGHGLLQQRRLDYLWTDLQAGGAFA